MKRVLWCSSLHEEIPRRKMVDKWWSIQFKMSRGLFSIELVQNKNIAAKCFRFQISKSRISGVALGKRGYERSKTAADGTRASIVQAQHVEKISFSFDLDKGPRSKFIAKWERTEKKYLVLMMIHERVSLHLIHYCPVSHFRFIHDAV